MGSLPVPSEKKTSPVYFSTHPLAVVSRPLPCNVGGVGRLLSNKKGTIFRTGKPVPSSTQLATNIASMGGVGVRHGETGGDVFFARDGLEKHGVALMFLRLYVCGCVCGSRVGHGCCCFFCSKRSQAMIKGELGGCAALSRDPMRASSPGTLPPTTGPAGATQLRETGRP